jgi:hypothetical protein
MRVLGTLLLLSSLLLVTSTACNAPTTSFPGTSAGTFTVTATLSDDSCGAGFQPDSMITYTTEIRADGSTSYWHRGDTPIAAGTYDPSGHFHFVAQNDIVAYGSDAGTGAQGCVLREIETIDGMLMLGYADAGVDAQATRGDSGGIDAGVHSTGFTGTDTIEIAIAPGSDCALEFASNGGQFTTLPCTAHYTMTATAN